MDHDNASPVRGPVQALVAAAIALALAENCTPVLAAGVRLETELSLERDDNPARAEAGQGAAAELVQTLSVRGARSQLLDERSGWVLHGEANLRKHDRYHALDELEVGGGAVYRIQPEVAYTAPTYELALTLERSMRSGSAIRNVTRGVVALSAGANLTDRLKANAAARFTRAVADTGTVADQHERAVDLECSYRFGQNRSLYARGSLARGDQMFSSSVMERGSPGVDAEAADPAFGANFTAYRSKALTRMAELGVFIPSTGRQGWNIWARAIHSVADSGATYSTLKWGVDWRYQLN